MQIILLIRIFKIKNYEIKKNLKIDFPNGVPPVGLF